MWRLAARAGCTTAAQHICFCRNVTEPPWPTTRFREDARFRSFSDAQHRATGAPPNTGYFGDGTTPTRTPTTPFTIPPISQRSIVHVLLENNISCEGYNDQWDRYLEHNDFSACPSFATNGKAGHAALFSASETKA
jgi:hypothetical protein